MLKLLALTNVCFAAAGINIPAKEIAAGVNLPYVSVGTWTEATKKGDLNVSAIINNWLDLGATGIDTAWAYFDQADIAKVLEARGTDRKKLFITSKLPTCLGELATRKFIDSDLKSLNTDYIDLMLIHAPGTPLGCDSTWKVMEEYLAKGALKSLGVSNWGPSQFKGLKYTIKPAVNQIQFNVFSHDDETEQYCNENNITIMAYSPLGDPARTKRSVFSDPNVTAIAKKHNVSQAQVALGWIVQKGYPLAVLSTNKDHLANDADLFSFKLDSDEISVLDKLKDKKEASDVVV
jgi:diketogulonate reductase-like aldo/keto reductase